MGEPFKMHIALRRVACKRIAMRVCIMFGIACALPFAATARTETPWQSEQATSHPNVYHNEGQGNHVFGYRFSPLVDGTVSQLGGRFTGAKTVVLIDNGTSAIIASALVTGTPASWSYASVQTPVALTSGKTYTVAARMNENASGAATWGVSYPFERESIRVLGAAQGWSGYLEPARWATTVAPTNEQNMKGLVDIAFDPAGANAPPSAPALLSPGNGSVLTASPSSLRWNASVDPDGGGVRYDVFLNGSPIADCENIAATTCISSGLGVGAYQWYVRARDEQGATSTSAVWAFSVAPPPGGDCLQSTSSNLQSVPASDSGCTVHEAIDASAIDRFDDPDKPQYWADFAGVKNTLSPACMALHDRYWTSGPDGDVYATWHPVAVMHPDTGEGCVFGHEHGDDPSQSQVFDYSGGWPPFGYVVKTKSSERVEDHFGHKVTVATFRAGIGNHPNDAFTQAEGAPKAIYDAGFDCHWLSKIHQGSSSVDAFANHLHEYFLTVSCDNEPLNTLTIDPWKVNARTRFAVRALVPFGYPNRVETSCGSNVSIWGLRDQSGAPLERAQVETPTSSDPAPNPRGFLCFNPTVDKFSDGIVDYLNEYDLWTQPYRIEGPRGLSLNFQAYYITKDPARTLNQNATQVKWTTERCRQYPDLKFCAKYVSAGQPSQYSEDSPFRGALRGINFKRLTIYGNHPDDPESFCTNTHGKGPTTTLAPGETCPDGMIEQKIAKDFENDRPPGVAGQNLWDYMGISGSLFVHGQEMKYRRFELTGAEDPFVPEDYFYVGTHWTGLAPVPASGICPASNTRTEVDPALVNAYGTGYCPLGIGFEKIVDYRDTVRTRFQTIRNAVGYDDDGNRYNRGIHPPN